LTLSGDGSGSGTTLSDGSYTFSGLNPGTYTVTCIKPGYETKQLSPVTITTGQHSTTVLMVAGSTPPDEGSLKVTVHDNYQPIEDVDVKLTYQGTEIETKSTDDLGQVVFTGLDLNAQYKVTVTIGELEESELVTLTVEGETSIEIPVPGGLDEKKKVDGLEIALAPLIIAIVMVTIGIILLILLPIDIKWRVLILLLIIIFAIMIRIMGTDIFSSLLEFGSAAGVM
jgi:hypothetical protein